MAATTERQVVVKHFAEKKTEYPKPVDLALDMRETQIRKRELVNEQDYIKKVLDAGYKSPIFEDLYKDVTAAKNKTSKSDETSK